jgi:hypothetical protein
MLIYSAASGTPYERSSANTAQESPLFAKPPIWRGFLRTCELRFDFKIGVFGINPAVGSQQLAPVDYRNASGWLRLPSRKAFPFKGSNAVAHERNRTE